MPHQRHVHSNFPEVAFGAFCFFSKLPLLLEAASSDPLRSGYSLEENFLFFLGILLFSDFSGSPTGSFLGKDFLLGRPPLPAVYSRSLLTSSSLDKDLLFLDLEKEVDESSIPFPQEASWNFCFFFFLGLSLFSSHSSGVLLFSEDARVIIASLFFSFFWCFFSYFSSFLVISAVTSSA